MKALVKYGEALGGLRYEDVPEPVCGADDLIVEVKAAGICGADRKHFRIENGSSRFNHIRGHEFSGVIVKTGRNVTEWKAGTRIVSDNTGYVCGVCPACENGDFLLCPSRKNLGTGLDGAFTKYVKIPGEILKIHRRAIWEIPKGVSFEEAAILDPICNAYKAIAQKSHLLPGQDVVVYGMGPLGMASVQIAKLMGAVNILAVGRKGDEKVRLKIARETGMTHFIDSFSEDPVEKARQICGPNGCGLIVDCVGSGPVLRQGLEILRPNGEFVRIGTRLDPLDFSINEISNREITIQGHMGYDTESWRNCLALLSSGKLHARALITHKLPLSQWEKGFELMETKEAVKVILTYDGD